MKNESEKALQKAVSRVYDWQYRHTKSFFNLLIDLMTKADKQNLVLLCNAYPQEVLAYTLWLHCPDQDEFFMSFGVGKYTKQEKKTKFCIYEDCDQDQGLFEGKADVYCEGHRKQELDFAKV